DGVMLPEVGTPGIAVGSPSAPVCISGAVVAMDPTESFPVSLSEQPEAAYTAARTYSEKFAALETRWRIDTGPPTDAMRSTVGNRREPYANAPAKQESGEPARSSQD